MDARAQANTLYKEGQRLMDEDRLVEAKAAFESALALDECQPVLTILGFVNYWLKENAAAEMAFRRSLGINPEDDEAHRGLGLVLQDTDPASAELHFREAIRIDPGEPMVYRDLGVVRMLAFQDFHGAQSLLRESITRDPDDGSTHCYLGHAFIGSRDYESARKAFEEATRLDPNTNVNWAGLADSLAGLGRTKEAEGVFLHALSLGIDNSHINLRYGLFLKRTGQFGNATRYLERVLEREPANRRALKAAAEIKAKKEIKAKPET